VVRWRRAGISAVMLGLVVGAVRADLAVPAARLSATITDVAVGLAFFAASGAVRGRRAVSGLLAGVGAAWLVGSFAPAEGRIHQAMLLVALAAVASENPRGVSRWVGACVVAATVLSQFSQLGVAAAFVGVVVGVALMSPADRTLRLAAVVSAGGVAGVLTWSWWAARPGGFAFDPRTGLLVYKLVLISVAAALVTVTRKPFASRAVFVDRLFDLEGIGGLDGLTDVLRQALRDPDLRVWFSEAAQASAVDAFAEVAIKDRSGWRQLQVDDHGSVTAVVTSCSPALDDPLIAAGVVSAVRLTIAHERLHARLEVQRAELAGVRERMVVAVDQQRASVATRLHDRALTPLHLARAELAATASPGTPESGTALQVVTEELAAAAAEVITIVAGMRPVDLGGGRLRDELVKMASTSPTPVKLAIASDVAGDAEVEATLFYVCSEALANTLKHADAEVVTISFDHDHAHSLVLTVADDGCGGADVDGSGLRGLADRLATCGGRLAVDSPAGGGTRLVATIPDQAILRHGLSTNVQLSNG
jgi:signal transduction histidine kinase